MQIKQLTNIQATVVTAEYAETVGVRQTINVAVERGVNLQITLGHAGVVISRGGQAVAIPIAELAKAAVAAEPALANKPQPAAKPA